MSDAKNRRPLDSRDTNWARKITQMLAARDITPNRISQWSMIAALIAGAAFWLSAVAQSHVVAGCLLFLAALACQLRLLCNLLDGMVAIEAGKSEADGAFWNEFPDRVSDILILVGAGLGAGAPALGFAAACMAVLTAYTRELGSSIGLDPNFSGPMAKPHRMALITGAALLAIFEPLVGTEGIILTAALWVVTIGAAVTSLRRARDIRQDLLKR